MWGGLVQADRIALACGFVTYTHVGLVLAWFPSTQMPVGTTLPLAEEAELEFVAELAGDHEDEFETFSRPKKRESMVVQNYKSQQSAVINNVASNSK